MSTCTCIIWHPRTEKERAHHSELLEYARSVNDPQATMIYLAGLAGPCLTREEETV
jgi:hypothetical protein